jgi:hypothetical protein
MFVFLIENEIRGWLMPPPGWEFGGHGSTVPTVCRPDPNEGRARLRDILAPVSASGVPRLLLVAGGSSRRISAALRTADQEGFTDRSVKFAASDEIVESSWAHRGIKSRLLEWLARRWEYLL